MKQVIRKCSLLLMFTLFLAVFVPVSAHAAKTMTVTVNGEENNRITLNKGDKVQIAGFGSFEASLRAARDGRNPITGETIHIDAKKAPKFKAAKAFKDILN